MSQYKNKTYPLRINNTLQEKVKFIADKDDRPISRQYELIVKKYIESYENEHGEIKLDDMQQC
ncbi:TraY domain-containing protein [Anaerotruncus sp. 1XD22-93]|nr:TraY domain-containing protein [Anaerotruncus sp. 1XD22-93]